MDYLTYFSQIFSSISGLGFIIGIIILYKMGLLEFLLNLKKNGNGNNKQIQELMDKVNIISGNDLNHIAEKLDKIIENTTKELIFLEDIRDQRKK